jgi:hypothetical protein
MNLCGFGNSMPDRGDARTATSVKYPVLGHEPSHADLHSAMAR